jgi:hypothetical protein
MQRPQIGQLWSEVSPGQKCETLPKKITKAKKGWGIAKVIKHLPSQYMPLISNPSTVKKQVSMHYMHWKVKYKLSRKQVNFMYKYKIWQSYKK